MAQTVILGVHPPIPPIPQAPERNEIVEEAIRNAIFTSSSGAPHAVTVANLYNVAPVTIPWPGVLEPLWAQWQRDGTAAAFQINSDMRDIARHYVRINAADYGLPTTKEQQEAHMTEAMASAIAQAKTDWADITTAIKHARRILLWGPPGTGKSYIAAKVPNNAPLYRLYLTMDTPAAEVRGHYLPNEKGGFQWHDGPGIAAWRTGGRLNIDEIDAASGDTLTLLMGLLDDPESARLTLPTNETVCPTDGFSVVATTNQQPTVMPEALLDRFDVVIHVKHPDPGVFEFGHWHSPAVKEAAQRVVYLGNAGMKAQGGRPIALRAFRAIDRLFGVGLSVPEAARLVVGPEAARWLCTSMKMADLNITKMAV